MASLFSRRKTSLVVFAFLVTASVYFFTSPNHRPVYLGLDKHHPSKQQVTEENQKLADVLTKGEPHYISKPKTVTEKVYVTVGGSGAPPAVTVVQTATVVSTAHSVKTVYADHDGGHTHHKKSPFLGNDISPKQNHLQWKDFETKNQHHFYEGRDANRLVSNEVWRDPASFPDDFYLTDNLRPQLPDLSYYENKAQYMRQPIVKDYAVNSDKLFLMMKTGATVMWNRIPIHMLTTFTRVPYFSIYSDMPASVAGYEVIDILANTTERTKNTGAYRHYTTLQNFFHEKANADPAEGVDGHDGWSLDRHKNVPMLAHGYRTAPKDVEWFFFMDGDTFMFMDNLMDYLNTLNSSEPLYLGCSHFLYGNERFAHGGSGVVLSRAALDITLGEHPDWEWEMEEETSRVCCGDYMVAKMMERVNITVSNGKMHNIGRKFNDEHHWSLYASPETWCDKVLGFHHVRPYEVELLWEYERSLTPEARKNITYADIYRDFTSPFVGEWLEEWDNMACEVEYCKQWDEEEAEKERSKNEESDKEENKEESDEKKEKRDDEKEEENTKPWHSAKLCQQECENMPKCLNWRYLPNSNYCGLGKAVRLGRAANLGPLAYDELQANWDHEHATSGYMIERIRAMRANKQCDVLYDTTLTHDNEYIRKIHDGEIEDRYEGWGLRLKNANKLTEEEKKLEQELSDLKQKKKSQSRKHIHKSD